MMSNTTDLQFQDFGHQSVNDVKSEKGEGATLYMFDHDDNAKDTNKLLSNENGAAGALPSFWTFEYYQQYFNVDTDQVLNRLINSTVPRKGGNFITQHIRPIPDLYGPFWISVTLIFTTGIFGNLTKYWESSGMNVSYEYDFRIVTAAATVIFTYVVMVPFALYALFWYRKYDTDYTYIELVSMYGYSLAVFIPVSILWVIHVDIFRWILILLAVFMSGSVLAMTLWPAISGDKKMISYGLVIGILALHGILAIGFKEYFFEAESNSITTNVDPKILTPPKIVETMKTAGNVTTDPKLPKIKLPELANKKDSTKRNLHEFERQPLTGMEKDEQQVTANVTKAMGVVKMKRHSGVKMI